jgi:hypothetical protein
MRVISRRQFGAAVMAAVPIPWIVPRAGTMPGYPIGVPTSVFNDLPRVTGRDNIDAVIRALQTVKATHAELALQDVEPAPPSTAPYIGGTPAYPQRIVLTPEQVAAVNAGARSSLRGWRLRTPPTFFEDVRDRFSRAGISVLACAVSYTESFTDDEIEATFRQVAALGLSTVSSPLTLTMARRLVPFAERHGITLAIHNQADGTRAGAVGTSNLADALALSPRLTLKLDVGNLTASNADAVAVLRRHLDRLSSVFVSDRLRNGGASQPFGEGDTPIQEVLSALVASGRPSPILVGYEYTGLRSSTQEVEASLKYVGGLLRQPGLSPSS